MYLARQPNLVQVWVFESPSSYREGETYREDTFTPPKIVTVIHCHRVAGIYDSRTGYVVTIRDASPVEVSDWHEQGRER